MMYLVSRGTVLRYIADYAWKMKDKYYNESTQKAFQPLPLTISGKRAFGKSLGSHGTKGLSCLKK
jgi:hypothetical protein